jgi:hypothetical protein
MQPLYNREGRAIAYIADNGISIYFYDGEAAGWVYQESLVFAYSGKFLGWLMYGWLCDPAGNPAFFTDRSSGGPKRPARQPRPLRSSRDSRPARRQRQERPPRPGMTMTWSAHSDESFFAAASQEAGAPIDVKVDLEAAPAAVEDRDHVADRREEAGPIDASGGPAENDPPEPTDPPDLER